MPVECRLLENVSLVLWNPPEVAEHTERPSVEGTREKLRAAGLPDRYAAMIPEKTAFRAAAKQMNLKDVSSTVFGDDGELLCQIDRLQPSKDGSSQYAMLSREMIGVWRHTVGGPVQTHGHSPETDEAFRIEYDVARLTYDYGDIGKILQNILTKEGLGVYSPRKAGGIYFIPEDTACNNLIARVENFCDQLGVSFCRFPVPDTAKARNEVKQAICDGVRVEIEEHERCVGTYSAETRSDVFSHRRTLMKQTSHLLIRLNGFMDDAVVDFGRRLDNLEAEIKRLEGLAAATIPLQGRRVISAK